MMEITAGTAILIDEVFRPMARRTGVLVQQSSGWARFRRFRKLSVITAAKVIYHHPEEPDALEEMAVIWRRFKGYRESLALQLPDEKSSGIIRATVRQLAAAGIKIIHLTYFNSLRNQSATRPHTNTAATRRFRGSANATSRILFSQPDF